MTEGLREKLSEIVCKAVYNGACDENLLEELGTDVVDAIIAVVREAVEAVSVEHDGVLTNGLEKSANYYRNELLSRLKGEER